MIHAKNTLYIALSLSVWTFEIDSLMTEIFIIQNVQNCAVALFSGFTVATYFAMYKTKISKIIACIEFARICSSSQKNHNAQAYCPMIFAKARISPHFNCIWNTINYRCIYILGIPNHREVFITGRIVFIIETTFCPGFNCTNWIQWMVIINAGIPAW